jgi:hypothetical protein
MVARLRAKPGSVYARDLATALDLPRENVCRELGLYDCADEVHRIALGGVEPYVQAMFNPLPTSPITAPIATDRVALSACGARARLDLDTSGAGLFAPLRGAARPSDSTLDQVTQGLYRGLLLRNPTPDESAVARDFYDEAVAESGDGATRTWAVMTCFAVATHVEALFY